MKRLGALALCLLFVVSPIALADPAGSGDARTGRPVPALFTNVTVLTGLNDTRGDTYAWGDYNNDGFEDLLVTGNRLFKNNGPPNWNFTNVTSQVGIDPAHFGYAVWGDYNNDGYLDFFSAGNNTTVMDTLWRNTGPPNYVFINASSEAGGVDDGYKSSCAACWVDYDRDSFLDVYVMNYRNDAGTLHEDALWHNNGNGTFTQVTRQAGIKDFSPVQAGMGVDAADYNSDGWPDIYAGNYLLGNNYLWHNNHNGTFTDLGFEVNVSGDPDYYNGGPYYGHTAGSCWGDYDNDGDLDLWVGNLAHKDIPRAYICDNAQLMKNLGFPFWFEDYKERAGIPSHADGSTNGSYSYDDDTFGGAWCDYDNDGWLDLYVPQVKGYHTWAWAELWHNNGDGTFTEVGEGSGIRVWAGIGCAWADYNNDGQPDHVTEGTYPYAGPRELHLFKNGGTTNHYLKVKLTGTISNRCAIGARLTVYNGTAIQIREVEGGTGGHSHQNSLVQGFGFGSYNGPVSLEIRWPSGIVQNITGITLDQQVNITENAGGPRITSITASNYAPNESETVTLSCTISGTPASFLWDLQGDGKFDTVLNSNQPVQVSYDRAGRYYPAVKILDGAGTLGQFESVQLIVKNVPPVSRAGLNRTVNETETLLFDGAASTDTPNDQPNLMYNWSFSDGLVTGFRNSTQLSRSFNQSGTYYATLCVRDDDKATSNDTIKITVLNLPPSVSIHTSGLAVEDTRKDFNATGNDTAPDLPALRYSWSFGDGSPATAWLATPNTTHTYASSGTFRATVTVKDDAEMKGNASIDIEVADVAPNASVELPCVITDEDLAVTLTGAGTDTPSDLGSLQFRWDLGDGFSSSWNAERSMTYTYTRNGTYKAVFFVKDHDNLTANASCEVIVRNLPPTVFLTTEEQSLNEDDVLDFDGTGRDTPTDALSLQYMWDFGDGNSTGWANFTNASHAYARKGYYDARLTVRDNDGAEASAAVEVSVENVAPTAAMKASKSSVDEDVVVSLSASDSTDTPSDRASLTYQWDLGDGDSAQGPTASHSYAKQKSYRVTLTVTDNDGATATATQNIDVKNVAPTITAWADKLSVTTGTPVNFTASGVDTPRDNETLKYEWRFGDGVTSALRNASHSYSIAGRYTAVCRVTDDDGALAEQKVDIEVKSPVKPPPPVNPGGGNTLAYAGGAAAAIAVIAVTLLLFLSMKRSKPSKPGPEAERVEKPVTKKMDRGAAKKPALEEADENNGKKKEEPSPENGEGSNSKSKAAGETDKESETVEEPRKESEASASEDRADEGDAE